jgi:hypothetical protein
MKTIRLILLFFIITRSLQLFAQGDLEVTPVQFEEGDLSANENETKRRDDASGMGNAAILKIQTNIQGLTFEPDGLGFVGAPVYKTGVVWLYLPKGAKKFDIYSDKGSKRGILYGRPIENGMVYSMTVSLPKGSGGANKIERKSQLVSFRSVPEGALVILDDDSTERLGPTPFDKVLPLGVHTYRYELENYQNSAGRFELTKDKEKVINEQMKPNFGFVYVESSPESGAQIVVNKSALKDKSTPTLTDALKPGFHTVYVSMKDGMYKTGSLKVEVKAGDTTKVNIPMPVNYANVTITTNPSASIYIDNKPKDGDKWSGRVVVGEHIFEARIGSGEKYIKAQNVQTLEAGGNVTIELTPTPRTGTLEVKTEPSNAKIIINGSDKDQDGKPYGFTPMMGISGIKLFMGKNTISFEKEGFSFTPKEIDIAENEITEIEEKLEKGTGIFIESSPSNATVKIDGKLMGKTPLNIGMDFGSHDIVLEKEEYTTTTTKFNVDAKQNKFNFTLYPVGESINITSSYVTASVYINEVYVGTTPVNNYKIKYGSHKIKLTASGYKDKTENLSVNPGGSKDFSYTLEYKTTLFSSYSNMRRETKEYFKEKSPKSYMFGYYQTSFSNDAFKNKIDNGTIEIKPGQAFCLRSWASYPFYWDMSWFSSKFGIPQLNEYIGDSTSIFHRGFEFSLGFALFNVSKHVVFYGGVGYQWSQLAIGKTYWDWITSDESSDSGKSYTKDGIYSSVDTRSPIGKVGVTFNFGHFQLFTEAKQSFATKTTEQKNLQLYAGAAIAF